MTNTDNTTAAAPVGELVSIPADEAIIEDNVRTAADLEKGFLASVKRHGVLLPTIGYRNKDGAVVVRDGQMRVLEAGVSVPVLLTDRKTVDAARITEQLVANEQRTALNVTDRLAAYRQLELTGMSEAAIARETGTKREHVRATLTVARSSAATAAVTAQALTLDEALIFAEFDDDAEAVAQLRQTVDEGRGADLAYWAERIRQDRARAAAIAAMTAEYAATGIRVVTDEDDAERLSMLADAGEDVPYSEREALDPEAHTACAGHAVTIRAWGELVAVPVCTTPTVHSRRYPDYPGSSTPAAPATPEEEEARREAERDERRRVRENNKAWDAADALRREFVTALLARKTLPKDTPVFVATTLTRFGTLIRNDMSYGYATLLGFEGGRSEQIAGWTEANPAKAAYTSLAVAVAAFENEADRLWWRNPSTTGKAYLLQLEKWGHHLTDVEKIATGRDDTTGTA